MTDFSGWSKESLEKLADELNQDNKMLRQQVQDLLNALRKEWITHEHTSTQTRSGTLEQPSGSARN